MNRSCNFNRSCHQGSGFYSMNHIRDDFTEWSAKDAPEIDKATESADQVFKDVGQPLIETNLPYHIDEYVSVIRSMSNSLRQLKNATRDDVINSKIVKIAQTLEIGDGIFVGIDAKKEDYDVNAAKEFKMIHDRLVDASISGVGSIKFDIKNIKDANVVVNDDLKLGSNFPEDENFPDSSKIVKCCPNTLRPYVKDYVDYLENRSDVGISLYRRFLDFFVAHGRFPVKGCKEDRKAFLMMVFKKDARNHVLPVNISTDYDCVLDSILDAYNQRHDNSRETILRVIEKEYNRAAREKMETSETDIS